MKNLERVAQLVAELRTLTENDFERHRIDVLERDLIAPPVIEVIDDTHHKFNGVIYSKNRGGHYTVNYSLHRAVWQYYHGEIPIGDYVVHHVDKDKANNDISNLQLLTTAEHGNLHNESMRRKPKICPTCGKVFRPHKWYTKYCSEHCFREMQQQQKQRYEKICPVCGKKFVTTKSCAKKQVCCSKSCAMKMRMTNVRPRL